MSNRVRLGRTALLVGAAMASSGCSSGASDGGGAGAPTGTATGTETSSSTTETETQNDSGCTVDQALGVGTTPGTTPAIGWNADRWTVAWRDAGETTIRVATIDASGATSAERTVAAAAPGSGRPRLVATADGGYLLVWQELRAQGTAVRGRKLSQAGEPEGDIVELAQSSAADPRPTAALGSEGIAVAWSDEPGVHVGLLDDGGIGSSSTLGVGRHTALAPSPHGFGLAWNEGDSLGFARLASPGDVLEAVAAGPGTANTKMAYGGERFWIVAEVDSGGNETVRLVGVDESNALLEVSVPSQPGSANWPDVAWTGDYLTVVYYQFRDGPAAVFLTRFDATGARIRGELEVSSTPGRFPVLAFSGEALGVAWADNFGPIRFARVLCE